MRVRARTLGYAPKEQLVMVRVGDVATADFALSLRSILLDQVVVTGTGGAVERRAVGNVIESINADQVMASAAPRSIDQLIGARSPGVIVLPATGQSYVLKVRGSSMVDEHIADGDYIVVHSRSSARNCLPFK